MFSVFKNINRLAGKSKLLDGFAIFCARFLPYLMVVFLFFYSAYRSNLYLFFYAIISGVLARLLNEFVRLFYTRERPARLEQTKVLIPLPKNSSFPSGHSSFFFGLAFLLVFYNTYLAVIFIVLSFFIGIARVFCGVHWFRDILAGVLVGFISGSIIYYLLIIIKI